MVFHCAANSKVRVSTTNTEVRFNDNVVATFNLLETMRKSSDTFLSKKISLAARHSSISKKA
ncbi:MAG: GDP-mannose 4,6-dehydratase [Candidatus Korarchaeota archaeon]